MIELVAQLSDDVILPGILPLYPVYLGHEQCEPGHEYGRVRDSYLIHYVAAGCGEFHTRHTDVTLPAGHAFLVRPGQEHWYRADTRDPWEYWWVVFRGPPPDALARLLGRARVPEVVRPPIEQTGSLLRAQRRLWELVAAERPAAPLVHVEALLAVLRPLLVNDVGGSTAAATETTGGAVSGGATAGGIAVGDSDQAWRRVLAFLEAHSAEPIGVETVCRAVGVSRTQLHRLCRRHVGHSAKEELTRRRMARAADLLRSEDWPIARIAALTGYREYQTFARQFRAFHGLTPRDYRRKRAQ